MAQQERENFYRHSTLIVDDTNEVFLELIDLHLSNESLNLIQFIENYQHEIYHLCYNNITCCSCPTKAKKPIGSPPNRVLHPPQLDILFDINKKHPNHNPHNRAKHCCCPVNTQLQRDDLDLTIARCLLVNFSNVVPDHSQERHSLEKLIKFRNNTYGHATKGTISNKEYSDNREEIEACIMILAKTCGREEDFRQKLKDAKVRPLDETICRQLQTSLLLYAQREEEFKTDIPSVIETAVEAAFEKFQRKQADEVPIEIKLMTEKRSVELYLTLLESGSEKKRDIRLVVVGKKGAGKTSLIKRLFGEDNTDVTSTNGIEIHKIKCKAKSNDGIWNKLDGNYEETETHARLLKEYEEKLQNKGTIDEPVESNIAIKDKTPETSFDESKKSGTVYKQPKIIKSLVTTESQVEPPVTSQQRNQSLEHAKRDIETMLKFNVDLHDKEEYATLLLWDFAGDEEFYHTHQTFLSPDAIYIVVTKLNEADDKKAKDLFQLWMDSIHCYSRLEEDINKSDASKRTSYDLNPPVVIVGTWKDALVCDVEEIDDACRENILKYTDNISEDELGHIRQEYFISNTEDDPSVFQQIRENILNLARKMKTWNKAYPLKFIQLEKQLQEKKKVLPIISFQEIQKIAFDSPQPLNDEELRLFLEFHHEIRALVHFKDLPSYIILDTQWLSNAFRCIVTAKKFRDISIRNIKKWDVLYSRGKLYSEVLDDVFRKENNFSKHKGHILNVMEKFDIIIRPIIPDRDGADQTLCYYVPCMIKSEPEYDIYEMFNVTENTCTKSTWLCYKFRFLPPHLMNHLIASLCRKYTVAEFITKEQKRQIALFRDSAVFELQKTTKLTKLHVMKCPNWIQIQVWQFGKGRKGGLFKFIDEFVTEEIVKIISTRFKMSNVKFEKKWECGHTKQELVTGSNDFFSEEQITEYYCETCKCTHIFIGEWQDLQKLSQSCEIKPVSNPNIESINQVQATSSKVCVRVKVNKRDISNIHGETSAAAILTGFTKEEINFTKMGMIALNILADALYDLLKQDKANLRPRSDCDITNLYSEHRKLNKHIPSGSWGGSWQTIRNTDIAIGDDIERIRLTRNELQHSRIFKLEDKRFIELCNILSDLLKRFDHHNIPRRLYTDELNDILAKTISAEEVKSIENDILGMMIEVEIEH